jgi:Zn-dependent peptidase ImmA (M78 family)
VKFAREVDDARADEEANEFARELLMPEKLYRAAAERLRKAGGGRGFTDRDVSTLAKTFEVPETEALLRLVALGFVKVRRRATAAR